MFAPFIPTPLMVEQFGHRILDELRQTHELPEIDIDDSAVVKAVRVSAHESHPRSMESTYLGISH